MPTEAFGGEEPPTDAHRCSQIVRLRMVLWEDSLVGSVGMAGMPYPPNLCPSVQSVGDYLALETSVDSVVSVGR